MPARFRNSIPAPQRARLGTLPAVGLILAALLLGLPSSTTAAEVAGSELPGPSEEVDVSSLALIDQYGESGGLATDLSGLQVAIVVSAKRLRRLKPWEQAIRAIDVEVPVIRVADVPRSAPTEYDTVAAKLQKRLPEDLAVLIDLQGVWAVAYKLDVSVPSVLIFDGTGALLAQHSGMYKKAYYEALEKDLTELAATAAATSEVGSVTQSP